MFSQVVRSTVLAVSILAIIAFLAAGFCLGGLGIGWLLSALIPSIGFGTAVLVAVVAVGFSVAMVLAILLLFLLDLRLNEQEQPEIGKDEEELGDDECETLADEEGTMLLGRFVELPKRRVAPDPTQSAKTKGRRGPKPRRGGK